MVRESILVCRDLAPQLGFLRVHSDDHVPWKSSNSSSIYPLSPLLEEPPVGRELLHPLVLTP